MNDFQRELFDINRYNYSSSEWTWEYVFTQLHEQDVKHVNL